MDDLSSVEWHISTRSSGGSGNCVEVGALADGRIAVRHSKAPDAAVIIYTRDEWDAFLAGARDGEFDFA